MRFVSLAATTVLLISIATARAGTISFNPSNPVAFPGEIVELEVSPPTLFVDAGAAGANNGTSWADAYVRLQDGLIDAAASGGVVTQIWVANGTYTPDLDASFSFVGDRTATFQLLNGVTIYGGFAGGETSLNQRNIAANETVLSGDLQGNDVPAEFPNGASFADNSYHILTGSGTDATAELNGFSVTGGNANDPVGLLSVGGAMLNDTGSPTVTLCKFSANSANNSAGVMYNIASGVSITQCTFSGNSAGTQGGVLRSDSFGNISVRNCFFTGNTASLGGAVYNRGASPFYVNCVFSGNTATSNGGAMFNDQSGPYVTNCLFIDNIAGNNGGGMYNTAGSAKVTNSVFSGNQATGDGGGLFAWSTNFRIRNCAFNGNTAGGRGGGMIDRGSVLNPTVRNSILWGNSDMGGMDESAQVHVNDPLLPTVVDFNLIQGLTGALGGTGNINGNPLFVDALGGDLRVSPGSPVIDAGDTTAVPTDRVDLDGDGDTAERTPWDLDDNPRVVDDPTTPDTGVSGSAVVDMGAFEMQVRIIFVDADSTGANNGTSWADAYVFLQDGLIDAAAGGGAPTEIWVANGRYTPDADSSFDFFGVRTATFQLQSGVTIYGGFAGADLLCVGGVNAGQPCATNADCPGGGTCEAQGGETILSQRDVGANVAILSGDLLGNDGPDFANNNENSYHVVTGSGTDATAVLDGCIITGGNADGPVPNDRGGGMLNEPAGPTVVGCTFIRNSAFVSGGGVRNASGNATFVKCAFVGNRTTALGGSGGGMANFLADVTVINCAFLDNSTVWGGGVSNLDASPAMTNCLFSGNTAVARGGAVSNLASGVPAFANCTFSRNVSLQFGGGLYNDGPQTVLTNCVFWENSDIVGMGEPSQILVDLGTVTVNYSLIQGLTGALGGTGNIDGDPLFRSPVLGDLRLSPGSPAIDAGDTTALPPDTADLDNDGLTFDEPIPIDLRGTPRVLDDPATVDTGVGIGGGICVGGPNDGQPCVDVFDCVPPDGVCGTGPPVVDMGAYEFISGPDCNINGLPDECDIDCNALAGACNVPGCGLSVDVTPADGVPDECVTAIPGGCGVPGTEDFWTCGDNWPLAGSFPDDVAGVSGIFVTMPPGADYFLNATVLSPGVTLEAGAKLRVTQEDTAGIASVSRLATGDLLFSEPARLDLRGTIHVDFNRVIDLVGVTTPEPLIVGLRGVYKKSPTSLAPVVTATLKARDVQVLGGVPGVEGGLIELSDAMSLIVEGTLLLQGRLFGASSFESVEGAPSFVGAPSLGAAEGWGTDGPESVSSSSVDSPPLLRRDGAPDHDTTARGINIYAKYATVGARAGTSVAGGPTMAFSSVAGDFAMIGEVETLNTSSVGMELGGDFDNQGTMPSRFDWTLGRLEMSGSLPQLFEVAGLDFGRSEEGYLTDADTLFDTAQHKNFSIGTLQIGTDTAGGEVTFVNQFANSQPVAVCAEALYVDTLILKANSQVTLDEVRVYYRNLIEEPGVTITKHGCGDLLDVSCAPPAAPTTDAASKNRFLAITPGNPGKSLGIRVTFDNLLPLFDPFWNGSQMWVGPPSEVSEAGAIILPDGISPTFFAATLRCTPHFTDWSGFGTVYVFHEGIMPSALYTVRTVDDQCPIGEETSFSPALPLATPKWGDTVGIPGPLPPPAPDGFVDIPDVLAVLARFGSVPDSIIKSRADLEPACIDLKINVSDALSAVAGFQGFGFPFGPPSAASPCDSTCLNPLP